MPRLFIAIPVPDVQARELSTLRMDSLNARWLPDAGLHLTLRFIGNVGNDLRDRVENILNRVERDSVHVRGSGLHVYPRIMKPRVLVMDVAHEPDLITLQQEIETHLEALEIPQDVRPFRPHVTLARIKAETAENVQRYLFQHRNFEMRPFMAREFSLYLSRTEPEGATYERLSTYRLH